MGPIIRSLSPFTGAPDVPHSLSAPLRAGAILSVALLGTTGAEESALLPKARVAIVGDSITEQKLYSK